LHVWIIQVFMDYTSFDSNGENGSLKVRRSSPAIAGAGWFWRLGCKFRESSPPLRLPPRILNALVPSASGLAGTKVPATLLFHDAKNYWL
jgi:hypothetical protein